MHNDMEILILDSELSNECILAMVCYEVYGNIIISALVAII